MIKAAVSLGLTRWCTGNGILLESWSWDWPLYTMDPGNLVTPTASVTENVALIQGIEPCQNIVIKCFQKSCFLITSISGWFQSVRKVQFIFLTHFRLTSFIKYKHEMKEKKHKYQFVYYPIQKVLNVLLNHPQSSIFSVCAYLTSTRVNSQLSTSSRVTFFVVLY